MLERKWYCSIEPIMDWWISNTPKWMQPHFVWTAYFFAIDRFP